MSIPTKESANPHTTLQRVLGGSRHIIVLAVLGTFFSAIAILLYAIGVVVVTIKDMVTDLHFSEYRAKELAITFLQLIDLFLLGIVVYIIALGLYELFIDDSLPTPKWLQIKTLDDLKEKLIGVVIVLLGVTFLGTAVAWNGDSSILQYGVAIAVVMFALIFSTFSTKFSKHQKDGAES